MYFGKVFKLDSVDKLRLIREGSRGVGFRWVESREIWLELHLRGVGFDWGGVWEWNIRPGRRHQRTEGRERRRLRKPRKLDQTYFGLWPNQCNRV